METAPQPFREALTSMKLVCSRHFPTQWNKQGLLQGRHDLDILPLDENCRQAIRHNQSLLREHGLFDLTCVSSLKRTRQTASPYDIQSIVIEPLLDEIDFGIYQGQPT